MTPNQPLIYLQFIGTQRSGSNLLRVMLDQFPEISAPHPPHILKTFFPLLMHYGDLGQDSNFKQLTNDVCQWVNLNPVHWEGIHFEPQHVMPLCKQRSLIEIFRVIYKLKAIQKGASYWCCKSMESVVYINELEQSGLKPIYLHLYRDGRDVALSFQKAIVGPKHIYHLAKKWKEEQEMSIKAKKVIPSERFFSIKYEDLIQKPREILSELCNFLAIPFSESALDYFHSTESARTAQSGAMWINLVKPILSDNHHKYLRELSKEQLEIFESVAGDMLEMLGYPRVTNSSLIEFNEAQIQDFNKENIKSIELAFSRADANDIAKRKPQSDLLNEIASRGRI